MIEQKDCIVLFYHRQSRCKHIICLLPGLFNKRSLLLFIIQLFPLLRVLSCFNFCLVFDCGELFFLKLRFDYNGITSYDICCFLNDTCAKDFELF